MVVYTSLGLVHRGIFCLYLQPKQGLAKQSRNIMSKLLPVDISTIKSTSTFEVISKEQVKRLRDNEIFNIGDYVSNGTKMKGNITGFEVFVREKDGILDCFVTHTWSGVGMGLEDLVKLSEKIKLPSAHQFGDEVWLVLWSAKIASQVHGVHFYEGKVKYDLTVYGGDGLSTRIYNVDSAFVTKYAEK